MLIEKSKPGRKAWSLPENDTDVRPEDVISSDAMRKDELNLPEMNEQEVVRHYINLSRRNFGVDCGFYPLGSCTMKYNPKTCETVARYADFTGMHPFQADSQAQGTLKVLWETERMLSELCGMERFSLQPSAGAQGELLGMMIIKAFHEKNGRKRSRVLIPDSSHGTNPSSANLCGFSVETIPSDKNGEVDLQKLENALDEDVAALMLTNPNTLGLFERNILTIADIAHKKGALLYYDGANLNAILGVARPGDMGFDVMHVNLHKTFATPHGGGGPGAGPVGVNKKLAAFLPVPIVEKNGEKYTTHYNRPDSIGRIHAFYGNAGVILKAYTYMRALGKAGIKKVSQAAVLNANYLLKQLAGTYTLPFPRKCMHEFVLSADKQAEKGVRAMDIAKRLIDHGYHPPTCYFPLIVSEALMIEPTETEAMETLDSFADAMKEIDAEIQTSADEAHRAPVSTPVNRLDEVYAARNLTLNWNTD